jgi:ABC-type Fe3+-hydroxamate transport system substrate-binding protein
MSTPPGPQRTVRDQLGRQVTFCYPPRRIVCLCPSLTETLFALGAGPRVVGRTVFCVHPPADVTAVPTVGGTKNVDIPALLNLRPDLVIAAQEENRRPDVEKLAEHAAVYVVDVRSVPDALGVIQTLGNLTDCAGPAADLIERVSQRFGGLRRAAGQRVAYLVWREPYMAAGRATYIDALLRQIGLQNAAGDRPERYPRLSPAELRALAPEVVLLPSEPYPFDETHCAELTAIVPNARLLLVDGELLGWYGARMLAAGDYLDDLVGRLADC